MRIEILVSPGCPNARRTRDMVQDCVRSLGVTCVVEEVVGDNPSPSVFVDGLDVMGRSAGSGPACRLDVPTRERVLIALVSASARPRPDAGEKDDD